MSDNRNWTIFRDRKGNPRWFQPLYEAWLVIRGTHSLHRAWQRGKDEGNREEYQRLVVNKAALNEIARRVNREAA